MTFTKKTRKSCAKSVCKILQIKNPRFRKKIIFINVSYHYCPKAYLSISWGLFCQKKSLKYEIFIHHYSLIIFDNFSTWMEKRFKLVNINGHIICSRSKKVGGGGFILGRKSVHRGKAEYREPEICCFFKQVFLSYKHNRTSETSILLKDVWLKEIPPPVYNLKRASSHEDGTGGERGGGKRPMGLDSFFTLANSKYLHI